MGDCAFCYIPLARLPPRRLLEEDIIELAVPKKNDHKLYIRNVCDNTFEALY